MAYSTPRTWVAGEYPTAAMLNQDIRDNQNAAFPLGVGAWTTWSPAVTQVGSVTVTNTRSVYFRIGRLIIANFKLTVTGSGTGGTAVSVSLPVTAVSATGSQAAGTGLIFDSSGTAHYVGLWRFQTTTAIGLINDASTTGEWGASPNIALAANDQLAGLLTYEAAI